MKNLLSFACIVAVLLAAFAGSGCAHMVKIDSAPGAEIYVDGQHVGQAPVQYQETSGAPGQVQVTAKLHGKEKTVQVEKSELDWGTVGAGSAAGFGACWGAGTVVGLVGLFVFPCIAAAPVAWALFPVGIGAGWYFGHRMPDSVRVDLDDGKRADAYEPGENADSPGDVPAEDEEQTKTAAVRKKKTKAQTAAPDTRQQF